MKNLIKIYNNQVEIKEKSFLKAALTVVFWSVIIGTITCIPIVISMFFDLDISYGVEILVALVLTQLCQIIQTIVIGNRFTQKENTHKSKRIRALKNAKKDYINVLWIILGFVLVRYALFMDKLSQMQGPISEESFEKVINTCTKKEIAVIGVIAGILIVIIGPIIEEILYRGIILNSFLNKYKKGPIRPIIYSAIFFGVAHLNIPQGINAFILGLILGYIYYKTKSLKLTIFAHMSQNLIAFVSIPSYVPVKVVLGIIGLCMMVKGIKYINKFKQDNKLKFVI